MRIFKSLSLFVTMILMAACASKANENVQIVNVDEFQNLISQGNGYLLDVRTPEEYAEGHIPGAIDINWSDQDSFKREVAALDKNHEVLVYCRSGKRSLAAANYLASQGFKVVDLDGGFMAWAGAGKAISTDVPTRKIQANAYTNTYTNTYTNSKASATAQQCNLQNIPHDSFTTPAGRNVDIYFVKHASLILDVDGKVIYVDPVTMFGHDYSKMDKADVLLVTHGHHDHFDTIAVNRVLDPSKTKFITSMEVAQLSSRSEAVVPGKTINLGNGITLQTTPAYNTTEDRLQYHPKDRKDLGFILNVDGMKIYIAGDTEVIDEMKDFNDIDIAFLPVNLPYTMTPSQAIQAIDIIQPKVVYPYHYGKTDLKRIVDKYADNPNIEVRIRPME